MIIVDGELLSVVIGVYRLCYMGPENDSCV